MINKYEEALISIIVPSYNSEKYIKKCLDSIISQTYKNFEVIVVDDGSTDNSGEIIKSFSKDDARIQYIYKENGGVGSARNLGIEKSIGSYISFIDSDDYVEKNFIMDLLNTIKEGDSFASCNVNYVVNGEIKPRIYDAESIEIFIGSLCTNKLYNAKIIKESKILFNKFHFSEDCDFLSRILIYNNVFSRTDNYIYNYVQNEGSLSANSIKYIDEKIEIVEDIEDYARKLGKFEENIDRLEFLNIWHILFGIIQKKAMLDDYSEDSVKKIVEYVVCKYPNWRKNKYIDAHISDIYFIDCLENKNYSEALNFLRNRSKKIF